MKFNNKLFFVALASLALAGCGDDWNEDKLDGFGEQPVTDVKTLEITLTDADYKTIATNSTNKSLAEAAGLSSELSKLTSNKYFTENIPASKYLPAYLAATYYTADNGSSVKVTSNVLVGEPEYLAPFNKAQYGKLVEEAYELVWGNKVQAYFLTPKTESQITKTLLPAALPEAEADDMVMVEYAYSDVEPSIGGGAAVAEPTWTEIPLTLRAAGNNWNYVNVGTIDLSAYKGQTIRIGFKYNSTTASAPTWELMNFSARQVPYLDLFAYAKQEDGSCKKATKVEAGDYLFVAMGVDGNYYPFGRLNDGKTYGYMYPKAIEINDGVIAADVAADYIVTLTATEAGYTIKNAIGQYFYMSGTYDSFNVTETVGEEGYDWTVTSKGSDQFVITNVLKEKSVKLNYYKGSYSFGSYAASKVEGVTYLDSNLTGEDNGGFTVYDKNIGDLNYVWTHTSKYGWKASAYVNNANNEAESYLVSPAIEVAEDATLPYFTIDEAVNKGDVACTSVWISTDYTDEAAAVNTRSVKANKVALYKYDGSAWNKASVDAGQLAVMQPADYASLSQGYVSKPENVLPKYVAANYPYAVADDVVVVAYLSGENEVSAKELTFDGTQWNLTTSVATQVDQFVKAEGKWNWDPSVTITLPAGKGQELSTIYFQAATDWVWEHVDQAAGCTAKGQGYVTSYGNNEYYCGCSAYQGNVDWRKSAAISQKPGEYDNMSDDEFLALMKKRFIEVMGHVLEGQYPDVQPVAGVKVTYTINFAVYTGSTANWTIQYELTGVGQFTYIEGSLTKVE